MGNIKVLYCNPMFLDYRLPYYVKLNELFNGNFYILFSRRRYEGRADALLKRILSDMGSNAIPFDGDRLWDVKTRSFAKIPKGQPIAVVHGLFARIRRERPDVLITEGFFQWTPIVALYGFLFRIPVFMGYERTCHTERNKKWYHKMQRKMMDLFIKGYIVNGQETRKYLLNLGVKDNKIHIGGMNADGDGLRKAIANMGQEDKIAFKRKFQDVKGLLFLFTGYLTERKGIKHLLAAWEVHIEKHPFDNLVMVGNGDQFEECKAKYANYPSLHFEGRVDYDKIHRYYAIADVYIMPTIEDNWSLVVPEAMSCGLPVATSVYNGCHVELVKNGKNGFTFDTFKHGTIVDVLDKFHHVNLEEFGKNSIELEKEYSTENCAIRTYKAIMFTLNSAKPL